MIDPSKIQPPWKLFSEEKPPADVEVLCARICEGDAQCFIGFIDENGETMTDDFMFTDIDAWTPIPPVFP